MFEGPPQKLGATWAPQLYAVKFRGGPVLYPGADPGIRRGWFVYGVICAIEKEHFSMGLSRAGMATVCAVPEAEIWRRL